MQTPPQFVVRRVQDMLCVSGTIVDNDEHVHHALQLVWSASERPAKLDYGDTTIQGWTLVIDGGVRHRLELEEGLVCLVDAHTPLSAMLRAQLLDDAPVWASDARPEPTIAAENLKTLLGALVEHEGWIINTRLDPRIKRVLSWLDELELQGRWDDVSLAGALTRVRLSESRFIHLFSQEVGTPWRSYIVWRRALFAMELALQGGSLTEAAHTAGYADSAHMSRQIRALFGYAPSVVRKRSRFIQS